MTQTLCTTSTSTVWAFCGLCCGGPVFPAGTAVFMQGLSHALQISSQLRRPTAWMKAERWRDNLSGSLGRLCWRQDCASSIKFRTIYAR